MTLLNILVKHFNFTNRNFCSTLKNKQHTSLQNLAQINVRSHMSNNKFSITNGGLDWREKNYSQTLNNVIYPVLNWQQFERLKRKILIIY